MKQANFKARRSGMLSKDLKRIAHSIEDTFPGIYYMSVTYEIWDEKSVEIGDTDEKGWHLEDVKYNSLEELLNDAEYDHTWLGWSSAPNPGPHDWIYSEDDVDIATGDRTIYNLFIHKSPLGPEHREKGLTPEEIEYISDRLRL